MTAFLKYGILAVMFAIIIVLVAGIISMSRGGKFNEKWGNHLMRARVLLQGLAVVLIAVMFLAS
ncbi:MAG: twin transmembrane helix small protein [Rhodospirillales bacterium]|nr:twin transmembrane helix small protein [Rhodospirillales bacterium]